MLPPTEASTSDWLGEKPAPHSCREKRLGTWVCFTSESKKGSRESSGCGGKRREGFSQASFWPTPAGWPDGMFLGKDVLRYWGWVERASSRRAMQTGSSEGPQIYGVPRSPSGFGGLLFEKIVESALPVATSHALVLPSTWMRFTLPSDRCSPPQLVPSLPCPQSAPGTSSVPTRRPDTLSRARPVPLTLAISA